MNSDWNELILELQTRDLHRAEDIASQCTSLGLYIEDYSDMEQMLPLIGGADYINSELSAKSKSTCLIHIYVPSDEPIERTSTKLCALLEDAGIEFQLKSTVLNDTDWENDWKSFHKPQKIGNHLVICPSWEDYSPDPDDVVLKIDPGSAFGSGQDETTKVCLCLLEGAVNCGDRVLDMGCGSGVLAIAALLLGAKRALGVDIDKNAVQTAAENAKLNGVGDRFFGRAGNIIADSELTAEIGRDYDLICANIVADVHILMCGILYPMLKSGGKLVISGIIESRGDEIRSVMENGGFIFESTADDNGWVGFSFTK